MKSLSSKVIQLINDKKFASAEREISRARSSCSIEDAHYLDSLEAELAWASGLKENAISLQSKALEAAPSFLPHQYRLACFFFDAERWKEADVCCLALIEQSISRHDAYFLDEAKFRRVISLHRLGRIHDAMLQFDEIEDGVAVFLFDGLLTKAGLAAMISPPSPE